CDKFARVRNRLRATIEYSVHVEEIAARRASTRGRGVVHGSLPIEVVCHNLGSGGQAYFPALKPPSIMNSLPVTKAASSLAKYTAAAAISSGLPMRPSACV